MKKIYFVLFDATLIQAFELSKRHNSTNNLTLTICQNVSLLLREFWCLSLLLLMVCLCVCVFIFSKSFQLPLSEPSDEAFKACQGDSAWQWGGVTALKPWGSCTAHEHRCVSALSVFLNLPLLLPDSLFSYTCSLFLHQ